MIYLSIYLVSKKNSGNFFYSQIIFLFLLLHLSMTRARFVQAGQQIFFSAPPMKKKDQKISPHNFA